MLHKIVKNRIVLATSTFGLGAYATNKFNEQNPELFLTRTFRHRMSKTKDLESQINIISFMDNPTNIKNWLKLNNSNKPLVKLSYESWVKTITNTKIFFLEKSLFGTIFSAKEDLAKKISTSKNTAKTIEEILQIYGHTIEAQHKIDEYIDAFIEENKWISCSDIKMLKNIHIENSSSSIINMLILAILTCPLDIIDIIDELTSNSKSDKLQIIKTYFDALENWKKEYIIETIIMYGLQEMHKQNNVNFFFDKIKEQLISNSFVKENLENYVDSFIFILSKLPIEKTSKLIRAFLVNKHDETLLIKSLINEFGIVGIKIAQFYSEYPTVPEKYKKILRDFKEANVKMSYFDIGKKINNDDKSYLGKVIGVGSVKQVHLMKNNDEITILGFTKANIEEDSQIILDILKKLPLFAQLASDCKKIISEELVLFNELQAFNKLSSIERFRNSNCFAFPEILDVSISTIQREFIKGNTIGKLHESNAITDQLLSNIKKLHILTIECAFYDNFVFSDFHFGNIIYNQELNKLVVIDAGQSTKVPEEDLTLFLWLIIDLVSKNNYMHQVFIDKLNAHTKSSFKIDLDEYNKAYQMPTDESVSYVMNLLVKNGYTLPIGFTACGKMLDIIRSQITLLGLNDDYFIDTLKNIIKSKISYLDYLNIGRSYFFDKIKYFSGKK
jgi:hypothetical protein